MTSFGLFGAVGFLGLDGEVTRGIVGSVIILMVYFLSIPLSHSPGFNH